MTDEVPKIHSPSPKNSNNTLATPNLQSTLIDLEVGTGAYSNPVLELDEEKPANIEPSSSTTMAHNFGSAAVDIELLEKEIAAREQGRREHEFVDLSGEIASTTTSKSRRSAAEPNYASDFDTLDEPVWDTVSRDLRTIGAKFGQVLVPKSNQNLLRDWDLWGPLFICVFISLLLQGGRSGNGPHFTEVFTLTFFGSCVVTLNTKLLGGNISFFQSLCVLGYCLLPPGVAAVLCKFIEIISFEQTTFLFALRLLVSSVAFIWAAYASMAFLSGSQPPKRKMLSAYPIFLFYFVVSWMIISHSSF